MSSFACASNLNDIPALLGLKEPSSPKLSSGSFLNVFQRDIPVDNQNGLQQLKSTKEVIATYSETEKLNKIHSQATPSNSDGSVKIGRQESRHCNSVLKSSGKRRNIDLNTLRVLRYDADNDSQLSAHLNVNALNHPQSSSSLNHLKTPDVGSEPNIKRHGDSSQVIEGKNKQVDQPAPKSTDMKTWRSSPIRFANPRSDPNERRKIGSSNLKSNVCNNTGDKCLNISPVSECENMLSAKAVSNVAQISISPVSILANVISPAPPNSIYINGQRYQIMRLLGEGGSSKVYEAHDASFRLVAIKCVNLEMADKSICDSFLNEIAILECLQSSDRVIKLYDYQYIVEKKKLFVVMERGDTDLSKLLSCSSKRGGITAEMVKFYWSEMLRAVNVIHNAGIIHSDLKPSNFLLVAGQLKLIDFGIASAIPADATSIIRDMEAGTLNYMSPEAFSSIYDDNEEGRRIKIGVKSDVWSLGCILHHMVYEHTPFHHIKDPFKKVLAIANPNYEIKFLPNDDKLLLDVLQKCIVRDVQKRASISDLLNHPYLTAKVAKIGSLESLISTLSELSPSSMNKVSEAVKQLKDKKGASK